MLKGLINRVFGTRHEREAKRVRPIIEEIHSIEALDRQIAELKEAKRHAADAAERERIDDELGGADGRGGAEGALRQVIAETLDELLPEAFATVREACRRLVGSTVTVTGQELRWDMVPYDVQLHGGLQLHLGRIAEMATGEGKTLVATLPTYLNALPGRARAP